MFSSPLHLVLSSATLSTTKPEQNILRKMSYMIEGLSAACARLASICILLWIPQTCKNSAGSFFYPSISMNVLIASILKLNRFNSQFCRRIPCGARLVACNRSWCRVLIFHAFLLLATSLFRCLFQTQWLKLVALNHQLSKIILFVVALKMSSTCVLQCVIVELNCACLLLLLLCSYYTIKI